MNVADLLDQLDGRAAERVDRPLDLGQAKARLWRGGADVGREHQLEAAADAVAIDRCDDRLRIGVVLQQGVVDHPRHFRPGRQIAADIGADRKGALTGAGQDDAAAIAVALQLVPEATELDQHLSRHGVEAWLIVDGDDRDVPAMPCESDLHRLGLQRDDELTVHEGPRRGTATDRSRSFCDIVDVSDRCLARSRR